MRADGTDTMTRRRFLNRISLALSAAAAAVVSVPIFAYLLSPIIRSGKQAWRDLGAVADFQIGQTVSKDLEDPSSVQWAGYTAKTAVWVRRSAQEQFTIFAVNCTHLGCPVNWVADANLFLCPCHGGVYYADGRVAGGPPPRPLFQYQWRIQNGHLEVQTRSLPIA
jgi:menaquinol-cytochrome c reductase iron-sulfur subunit